MRLSIGNPGVNRLVLSEHESKRNQTYCTSAIFNFFFFIWHLHTKNDLKVIEIYSKCKNQHE